jgi:hypothetical protein
MFPYDTFLTRWLLYRTKGEREEAPQEAIKDRDTYSAKALELEKDRDLWKGRCNQMVAGIKPVLDLVDLELQALKARA